MSLAPITSTVPGVSFTARGLRVAVTVIWSSTLAAVATGADVVSGEADAAGGAGAAAAGGTWAPSAAPAGAWAIAGWRVRRATKAARARAGRGVSPTDEKGKDNAPRV